MKTVSVIASVFLLSFSVEAQEEKELSFSIGGDFVSSYVWRGIHQTGASIQPSINANYNCLTLSAWGNTDVANTGFKEVDFSASYSIKTTQLSLTDYWWVGEDIGDYYNYKAHRTGHLFEATASYELPLEKYPLSISWSTMFAGADYTKKNGKRAYSSYFELNYPVSVKDILLNFTLGGSPWEGLYSPEFAIINCSLKVSKRITITDKFSLPIFGQIITNPQQEDTSLVFGFSL